MKVSNAIFIIHHHLWLLLGVQGTGIVSPHLGSSRPITNKNNPPKSHLKKKKTSPLTHKINITPDLVFVIEQEKTDRDTRP